MFLSTETLQMCIRDRIITYAHPILLTTETNKIDSYRITERRALRLIYRRPPITKTPNTTLYALNKHFPDPVSYTHLDVYKRQELPYI